MADDGRCCCAPDCGKPIVRKPGEAPSHFERRTTCDKVCGERKRAHWNRERHRAAMEAWIARQSPEIWAEPVGEIVADFSRFNIDPGDKRGYVPPPPATHVQKQSSIA